MKTPNQREQLAKRLLRIGFVARVKALDRRVFKISACPKWNTLRPDILKAWLAIADFVIASKGK